MAGFSGPVLTQAQADALMKERPEAPYVILTIEGSRFLGLLGAVRSGDDFEVQLIALIR